VRDPNKNASQPFLALAPRPASPAGPLVTRRFDVFYLMADFAYSDLSIVLSFLNLCFMLQPYP
jgi:hypothetical protein